MLEQYDKLIALKLNKLIKTVNILIIWSTKRKQKAKTQGLQTQIKES